MASLSRPMQADPGHKGRAAMPGGPRSLPRRPSLRYLKLEAKRRVAAGEFAALHDAQAAIAWEHGLPNWTALKQLICGQAQQQSHALAQVRWVIARFRDAGEPGWIAPDDDELRLHFDDQFLSEVPAAELIAAITSVAADLREEPTVIGQAPLSAHIQIGGLEVFAAAEANPPHRLTGLQAPPLAGGSPTLAWRHRRLPVPSARFPLRWPGSRMRPSPSWAWPPWSWPAAARTPQRGWLRGAGRTWTGAGCWTPATGSRHWASPRWSPPPLCCGSSPTAASVSIAPPANAYGWCAWLTTPSPSGNCSATPPGSTAPRPPSCSRTPSLTW